MLIAAERRFMEASDAMRRASACKNAAITGDRADSSANFDSVTHQQSAE